MSALTIKPAEVTRLKGLGFLNNKGTDNFSARVLTVNGKITARQMNAITNAAETFGNGILTFTTRQTVEVQGIPYDNIEPFLAALEKEDLETGGNQTESTTCSFLQRNHLSIWSAGFLCPVRRDPSTVL